MKALAVRFQNLPIARKWLWGTAAMAGLACALHWFGVVNLNRVTHLLRYGMSGATIPFRELKVRVVDENGAPIEAAEVSGYIVDTVPGSMDGN